MLNEQVATEKIRIITGLPGFSPNATGVAIASPLPRLRVFLNSSPYLAHTNPYLIRSKGLSCPYKITRLCSVPGCKLKHVANGFCSKHESRERYPEKNKKRELRKYGFEGVMKRRHPESTQTSLALDFRRPKSSLLRKRYSMALTEWKTKKKVPFLLTFEEFKSLAESPCYYCGGVIGKEVKFGKGLDRVDNSKGYEIGNVLPSCYQCNATRSNKWTVEETMVMIRAVIEFRKAKSCGR